MTTTSSPPDQRWIDEVEHPAAGQGRGRRVPAGQVVGAVLVAVVAAAFLNSAAMVRAGEGMDDGVTRTLVLAAARPIDAAASTVGLDLPRRGLDAVFGQDAWVAEDTALTDGSDDVLDLPVAPTPAASGAGDGPGKGDKSAAEEPELLYPQDVGGVSSLSRATASDPVKILVTGDSLASYIGVQMANEVDSRGNVAVKTFNGTGLTRPDYFNWQVAAENLSADRHPDAVVVVMGGNDGWNMSHDGSSLTWGSPEWIQEYARRVAVVSRAFLAGGADRVYWSGPPTARDAKWNGIFRDINAAVTRATRATPGARFVDLFEGTSNDGRYTETLIVDGKRVSARQSDGIHFSLEGAARPASLLIESIEREYGVVR